MELRAFISRAFAVVASLYTAMLQLTSPMSLAYRAAGDSIAADAVNLVVLGLALVAGADLLWRDILRRGLIWPSFPMQRRHHICVLVYSSLASAFGIRAFLAAGDISVALQAGTYYVLIASLIAMEAYATAKEGRQICPTESNSV